MNVTTVLKKIISSYCFETKTTNDQVKQFSMYNCQQKIQGDDQNPVLWMLDFPPLIMYLSSDNLLWLYIKSLCIVFMEFMLVLKRKIILFTACKILHLPCTMFHVEKRV